MKRIFLALLVLVTGLVTTRFAQADGEEMAWTLHGLYVEPNFQAFVPFNDNLDVAPFVGGKVGYQWNQYVAVEVDAGWTNPDLDQDAGDVTVVPLLFNARVNLWPGVYMVDPYLFGGIGVSFNDIEVVGDDVDIDNSFAGQIGGGVEYHFNENVSGYLDMRFYFSDPDLSTSVLGESDVDLNSFLVGGGVVWRF